MRMLTIMLMLCLSAGGVMAAEYKSAVFAGGCFWCLEGPFDELSGVIGTESGYTGGTVPNPTYEQVSAGTTGHVEAMRVVYDPAKVTFEKLLSVFWRNIDPTDGGGQFCDRGPQYRSAIFFADAGEETEARRQKAQLEEEKGMRIVTEILPGPNLPGRGIPPGLLLEEPPAVSFLPQGCGRDQRLRQIWGAEAGGKH
jgi:peptide-methionine (S)-S-oxide reductase